MTDDKIINENEEVGSYAAGYNDGLRRYSRDPHFYNDEEYDLGYTDGQGDRSNQDLADAVRPVDDQKVLGDPPPGYEWTGEKKTPEPGEYYLTKNGNAKLADKVRGNAQQRHILRRI